MPGDCVAALRTAGHEVLWIRESLPGANDEAVLARAHEEARVLLTFDKDFGALVFGRGKRSAIGVILLRISQPSAAAVAGAVVRALASRDDWSGNFSVVEDGTVRMRALP